MSRMTALVLRPFLGLFLLLGATRVAAQAPATSLTGKWAFEVVTANGTGTPAVVLKQEGEKVTGTYTSSRGGTRQIDGVLKGDKLTFTVKSPEPGGVDYEFTGTVAGDTITGTADFSGMGTATFSAKRSP